MTQLPSGLSTRPESFASSGESSQRLRQAIECLTLTLDDELHRYRKSRSGQSPVSPTPTRLQLRPNRKPIDLIGLKKAASTAVSASSAPGVVPPPPPVNARLNELLGQSSAPSSQAYPPKATVNQVRLSHGGTLTTYRPAPDDYLESSEALLGSLPKQRRYQPNDESYAPSLVRQLTSPLGMGALLLLLVGSASFGYLVTSPSAVGHLTDNPIARRLRGEPAPTENAERESTQNALDGESSDEFTPLGPNLAGQEFTPLDLSTISTLPSSTPTTQGLPTSVQPTEAGGRPLEAGTLGSRPGAPAAGRSAAAPSTIVRAEIVNAPTVAAGARPTAAQPSAPAQRPAPAAPAAPPAALQMAPPRANVQPPQPLARDRAPVAPPTPLAPPAPVAPPAPLTQAPPAAAPSYYVVTDYNGAQSLDAARSAVGDAYVRNFSSGTRIQLGAFSQQSSAQNLVNQLQGQGIPAQVISP